MIWHRIAAGLLAAWPGLALAAPPVAGPTTASAPGSATATILAPIVVTHTPGAALSFGSFTPGAGGTVVISPAGAASSTGGVVLVAGSARMADTFAVEGDPNRGYAVVTAPGSVVNGAAAMVFTTTPSTPTAMLNAAGTGSFAVGGTLTVPANAASGAYSGSYSVTVNYN